MPDNGLQFSQFVLRHDRALLRYIMTFIPRRDDAEEVLQRTVTSLWQKFSEFDSNLEFLPWALRFTYFEILNFRKEWARSKLTFDTDVLKSIKMDYEILEPQLEDAKVALRSCLQKVDPEGLDLLRWRYCESKSVTDLATQAGKTPKSLYRKLDRVREMVARCVSQQMKLNEF